MPQFSPPVIDGTSPIYVRGNDPVFPVPRLSQKLFRHFKLRALGQTVLKATDGTYETVSYPEQDQIDAAAIVYLGGHIYEISDEEADELTDAGYGDWIS